VLRLGVDLGGTKIEAALLESDGSTPFRERVPTPNSYPEKILAIRDLVLKLENAAGLDTPLPVGIGHPGSLNPRTGIMRNANSTALNGHAFDNDLQNALNRPVRCSNDANCFALSEARDGAGRGARSVFGVIAGTGVGGGMVLDGQLITGTDGNAGEWGHTALPRLTETEFKQAPACHCGLTGCVEAWCSGPALSNDHARNTGETLTAHDIAKAAQQGDVRAQASLDRHADRFARALSNIINVFDPEVIVLGGGLSNLEGFAERLQTRLANWAFTDELVTQIRTPVHGDSSGVRGAAWLWETP